MRALKQSLVAVKTLKNTSKYKGPFRMNYIERGSHARGVYYTLDISRAHGNSKGEAKGRRRHRNNSKRVV